jgi:signal transduction histidine kinase/ligand-binding sensor domain-containing protein
MRVARAVFLIGVALAFSVRTSAFDVDELRARYTVTSWTEKDGMPSSFVRAIAQDRDGYLWLATYSGLVRFDGARFVTWKDDEGPSLPSEDLSSLLVARDGSLWVGGLGGLTHLVNHRIVESHSAGGELLDGYVQAILEDTSGVIWAAAQGGVAKFDGSRWTRCGLQCGLPERSAISLLQDDHGTLWVGTSVGLFRRGASDKLFQSAPPDSYAIEHVAQDAAGHIVVTHPTQLLREEGAASSLDASELNRLHGTRLLRDSQGYLWVGTRGHGVVRLGPEGRGKTRTIERLSKDDGLSSESVQSLFEDREGDIWIGTPFGLNRLSKNAIIPVPTGTGQTGQARAIASADDGSIWAATDETLLRFHGTDQDLYEWSKQFPTHTIIALHGDWDTKTLWISTNHGLVRFQAGKFTPFELPDKLELNRIRSITSDKDQHLWLCDADRGVFRSTDSTLTSFESIASDKVASSVYPARDGTVWIGFVNGTVRSYQNGKLQSFGESEGLPGGTVTVIYEDRRGTIWVGSHAGLSHFENNRFVALTKASGFPATGPVAIAEDNDGYLWLGVTGLGVIRLSQDEFERSVKDRSHRVQYRLYGTSDGLRSTPVRQFGTPSSAQGADGTLWFLTGSGFAVVDPNRLRASRPSPPLMVEAMITDTDEHAPTPDLTLPPNTSKFEIDYTLLSLAPLSQVNFRYRLEGFDEGWIEAGTRRQAFYTNVPPGHYRFRVEAVSDAASSSSSAAWQFAIQPKLYQTRSFALGMAAIGVFGLWGLWQLRLHQMRRRFAVVLEERARMGREIHDTLLQGLVGVAVQFKVIADLVHASPGAAKERLDRLRKLVEHYIHETRQSIWDLRSETLAVDDLATALRTTGETVTADKRVRFEMAVAGKPLRCPPKIEEQLLRVGREALLNAVQHANPSRVRVELSYDPESVRLRVIDDGLGFNVDDPNINTGAHWGLTSMRERARQVNGQFQLASAPGKGTQLELTVPLLASR